MTAPTIRTIKAVDIKRGKGYKLVQDKTEILDFTVDFTSVFGSGISTLQSAVITLPSGITQAGSTTIATLFVTFALNTSAATYDTDYTINVRGYENAVSSTATKVEISFTVRVKDL
jgi:hypothetical protein